jgi:hypothetical protein
MFSVAAATFGVPASAKATAGKLWLDAAFLRFLKYAWACRHLANGGNSTILSLERSLSA